ncbi:hypothetical protein A5674_03270 [Mycobacterium malmoense]|uniref:hypothetical protein n=1 Tax=Mycobacterium malmoense TaxID=1780 RepID=UPI00080BEB8F|nr:hypothetical protein [Mycobacterium malmoense]OCB21298.1 hypothetical protein A5674_03270 [Mycobacterium malmoense]
MSSPEQPIDETIEEPTPEDYQAVVRAMQADGHNIDDPQTVHDGEQSEPEPETFPRSYVEDLRQENGKYRQRAQQADAYAQRLHTELVRATGRLADPTDLPFDAEHLDDPDKLSNALDDLLASKPHLASRRPTGDIGQGDRGPASGAFSLLGMLKERT